MGGTVRVLRLLEYVGDRDAIEDCLARRGVKGIITWNQKYTIREAFLAPGFPEKIEAPEAPEEEGQP